MKYIFKQVGRFNIITGVINNNSNAFTGFPEIIATTELFISNKTLISQKASILNKPKSEIFGIKTNTQQQLRDELGLALGAGIIVARRLQNIPLLQSLKKNKVELKRTKIHDLPELATRVYNELKINEDMAVSSGYNAEKLTALKDLTANFREIYKSADYEFNERKTLRTEINKLISDNILILQEELDPFASNSRETFPAFYNAYTTARARKKAARKKMVSSALSDICGTATNSVTGEPIANATITLKGDDTAYTTDADGYYVIDEVLAGECTINCFAPQYNPSQLIKANIAAGESLVIDFSLEPVAPPVN